MARIIQVLLPLVCVVLAEAQLHLPFFDHIPRLPHPARPITDGPRDKIIGYNGGDDTWFEHFGNPDEYSFYYDSREKDSYEDYGPYYHRDPYFQGNSWDQMPGINNVLNIPNPGYNAHRYQPHNGNNPQERPKQDHKNISNVQKSEENSMEIPTIDINSDVMIPKNYEIEKEDQKADKHNEQVGLEKMKDFLLVGQDDNGNNVYLLHENHPKPSTVITPNANFPGNNILYVPYNPGQTKNPVYQFINRQPGSIPTNVQITQDKMGVLNGNNNAIPTPGQSTMNLNTGNQNPGYVTIYSNGQFIQVPGVVVNSEANNVPSQNGNQGQGTNYIIANTVPNNVQAVPAVQNPDTNVIYPTIPNQASNGPIYYVQVPNSVNAMANGYGSGTDQGVNNGMSNNGLPSNVVIYQANPNTVAQPAELLNGDLNGYVQANMVANQGEDAVAVAISNQDALFSHQNGPYQPIVLLPVNSGTNGYNQPIVSNLGQGQNAPNQEGMMGNQNVPIEIEVQLPVGNSNDGYNQPMVTNQRQGQNIPYQGAIHMPSTTSNNGYNQPTVTSQRQQVDEPNQRVMYYQYTPQPAIQMPVNNGMNGDNQPIESNQSEGPNALYQGVTVSKQNTPLQPAVEMSIPNGYNVNPPVTNPSPAMNVESPGDMASNQNIQLEPSVAVNSSSNGYQQPQVPNQGDQGTNAIVNTPNNGQVINQESDNAQPLTTSSLIIDSNNLSSIGAEPAIINSDFKDKSGAKKEKKKSEDTSEPFTNKIEDVKR